MKVIIDKKTGEIRPPFLRTAYNYDITAAANESALNCQDPSLAKESFKEECDINTIVKKFGVTGKLPDNIRMPTYGDYTNVPDFRTALHTIIDAEAEFMKLPADFRYQLHNDPQEFLQFVSDEKNRDKLGEMGLIKDWKPPLPQTPNDTKTTQPEAAKSDPPK